jgi:REP-associated tyrosine transposase
MAGHRAFQMYAHITWHTWRRRGCVDRLSARDVVRAVDEACQTHAVNLLRGAVLADHVHLVISFRPDTRVSDFVRHAKSLSATRANERVPGTIRWARGYYVTTLHRNDLARVIEYVSRQFQRHPDLIPKARRV